MPKGPQGQKRPWDIGDIVKLIEGWENANDDRRPREAQ